MAKESLVESERLANRQDTLSGVSDGMLDILRELQGLKIWVSAGAAANTNVSVVGITTEDTVLACIGIDTTASPASAGCMLYADFVPTSAGNIQSPTASTEGKQIITFWYDKG